MSTELVDLKYSDEDQSEYMSSAPDMPQYPYGMAISLCKSELDKLGLNGLSAGDEVHMMVVASVTSTNVQPGDDDSLRVGLQITMAKVLLHESAEDEGGEDESPAAEERETKAPRKYGVMSSNGDD